MPLSCEPCRHRRQSVGSCPAMASRAGVPSASAGRREGGLHTAASSEFMSVSCLDALLLFFLRRESSSSGENWGKIRRAGAFCRVVAVRAGARGLCVSVPRTRLSAAGHLAERALWRIGAAGRSVSQAVWSALWLAAAAPGGYAGSVLTPPGWAANTAVNDSPNPRTCPPGPCLLPCGELPSGLGAWALSSVSGCLVWP